MISFVIKNGGPQPVQCCFTLAVCSAIFSLDSSQISMNTLIFGKIRLSKKWFLLPYLSRFGRRTSFFSLLFMEVSVSIITCFSPTYTAFTVLRTLNGVTFPALFQIPFILCKSASDGPIFCQPFKPFFARSGNNGSRLPYLRRHDDLFVLCCRVNDPGRGGLHFQLVAGFGICQFLSFYRVI